MKLSTHFNKLLIVLFLIKLTSSILYSQAPARYTISGYIYEKGSRETLIGVNVYVPELRSGTITNTYGFYAITLPGDSLELLFTYVGYQPEIKKIHLQENLRLDIELLRSVDLGEVVVEGEKVKRVSQVVQMSRVEIPISQATRIPSFFGEKDMFKVLQLMPGVQSGTEGTSGFYVRGGGPDQNLIILDDAIVYNASHLFGFFSIFNGDAIKNMQLYKGGFPARFGGRLSSVLDIQMKDGNKEKFQGETGIGLLSSRLTLEGPVVKNKSSFLISGRRTYVDALMRPFMSSTDNGGYFFYDLNAKLNFDIDPNNRIFVSAYLGRDKFYSRFSYSDDYSSDKSKDGLYWQNATSTIRWNHIFNDKLFANTSLIYSDYTLEIYSDQERYIRYANERKRNEMTYLSGIQDIGIKYDLSWYPHPNHQIRSGFQSTYHEFTPRAFLVRDDDFGRYENNAEKLRSIESGIYIEDEIQYGKVILYPGFRATHFYTNNRSYFNLEPRIAMNYMFMPVMSWKLSYAAMNQYVHLLTNTGIALPTDLWVPSTEYIQPQHTSQIASGLAYDWMKRNLAVSLEGYYKKSNRIIGYKPGASFLLFDDPTDAETFSWQDNITDGEAWSYGLEFLIQRKAGRFSGWIGYTLSWTQHRFDSINFGKKFWAHYDRRHDVSLVGIYELRPGITLSGIWVYATGKAYDLAQGRMGLIDHAPYNERILNPQHGWYYVMPEANIYGEKNSFRAAPYHRFDLGIQFHKNTTKLGYPVKRTIELGAYNLYSRKNPFFYFWDEKNDYTNNTSTKKLKQISLFPILPSISVNFKF